MLVTGVAGFIGSHLAKAMLNEGLEVIGIDNLCSSYDPKLKKDRLAALTHPQFRFLPLDISDEPALADLFSKEKFEKVFHFAAQGGVVGSSKNPQLYLQTNVNGFLNILECCRQNDVRHLIYASSSSVYGANNTLPYSARQPVDHPLSVYAVTKRTDELMAHSFSHLYRLPTTGLRLFTVYGPWGRPDMAIFRFTKAILENKPIKLFNDGKMKRDFTYIDDAVNGILKAAATEPKAVAALSVNSGSDKSSAPFRIYNIGCGQPIFVSECVEHLEQIIGKKAQKTFLPAPLEDVSGTHADISEMKNEFGFLPSTGIQEGLDKFYRWYAEYYSIRSAENI